MSIPFLSPCLPLSFRVALKYISLATRIFYPLFLPPVALGGCSLFISDCINVFRSRYKAARTASRMYCSRILRYEYTRRSYVTILTSAECLACISSRNFIPRLSHVYVSHYSPLTRIHSTGYCTHRTYCLRCIQRDSFCFCNIPCVS